jgi:hypothetical protein
MLLDSSLNQVQMNPLLSMLLVLPMLSLRMLPLRKKDL